MVVGAVAYMVTGDMSAPVAGLIWAGVLLSLLFVYVNFPEIRAALTGRSAKYGANAVLMVLVFTVILVIVAMMSMKYKMRLDLTATKRYTLSDQTLKILDSLDRDVEAIAFYRTDERTRQAMEDLLESYASESPRFTYWFVDPDKKPALAEKYGVTSYRTTLLRSGGREERIGYESEEKITNALLKVTRDYMKSVYFLKGHGENSISSDRQDGYKAVKESLEKENFSVKELLLVEEEAVPEDCAVLVVSGPKRNLLPSELDKITAYIDGGGSVLFMLDPGTVPALVDYLGGYGFHVGDDIVIDTLSQVFGANYLVPVVTAYEKDHPITAEFNLMTFFPLARSVAVQPNPEAGIYMLASTGKSSWAETDRKSLEDGKAEFDEDEDRKGPVPLVSVVLVETKVEGAKETPEGERKTYAKLITVGDSDFVSNTHINLAGNRDFFLNIVSWLAEEADLISIRKKQEGITPVILTATQGRLIFWVAVVMPPTLVGIAGLGVFFRKRLEK